MSNYLANEIRAYTLPIDGNPFAELLASVRFEDVGKGRQGAVLIKIDEQGGIPIVRTTTRYNTPAQCFQSVHDRLARQIQEIASLPLRFNNALIENYTNAYTKMGGHSDQALDLAEDSVVAIFSCYKYPERLAVCLDAHNSEEDRPLSMCRCDSNRANPPRQLLVESKESGGNKIEIPLTHNSVVLFDLDTNRRFKHKIVLDASAQPPENQWLGITFRTSKTCVRLRDEYAYFSDDTRLTLADDEQRQEFYRLRHRENDETNFIYPRITYTISESDLMPPERGDKG